MRFSVSFSENERVYIGFKMKLHLKALGVLLFAAIFKIWEENHQVRTIVFLRCLPIDDDQTSDWSDHETSFHQMIALLRQNAIEKSGSLEKYES